MRKVEGRPPDPAQLATLSDAELAQRATELKQQDRSLRREMAPLQKRLDQLDQRQALVVTEQRRRERQQHILQRRQARTQVTQGQAPSLLQVVEAEAPPEYGEPAFSELEFVLETGGVVALGYPGTRVPSLQMTDGATVSSVAGLAEARRLFREGWDFGVPARPGVRVHTPGTRLERLLDASRCFVRPRGSGGEGTAATDGGS